MYAMVYVVKGLFYWERSAKPVLALGMSKQLLSLLHALTSIVVVVKRPSKFAHGWAIRSQNQLRIPGEIDNKTSRIT